VQKKEKERTIRSFSCTPHPSSRTRQATCTRLRSFLLARLTIP